MSFTYDKNTNPLIYKIRRYTQDTDISNPDFSDEDLIDFYEEGGTEKLAAAIALETLASKWSKMSYSKNIGGKLQYDYKTLAAELRNQAKMLRETDTGEDNNPFTAINQTEVY